MTHHLGTNTVPHLATSLWLFEGHEIFFGKVEDLSKRCGQIGPNGDKQEARMTVSSSTLNITQQSLKKLYSCGFLNLCESFVIF